MRQLGFSRTSLVFLAAAGMSALVALAGAHADETASPNEAASPDAAASPGAPTPQSVDVSGHWLGTWTAPAVDGARTGVIVADFTQAGSTGTGKVALHDTMAAEAIPTSLRRAGGGGVPVVLALSGAQLRVEHELGSDLVSALLEVTGDRMVGLLEHSQGLVRISLSRGVGAVTGGRPVAAAAAWRDDRGQMKPSASDASSPTPAVRALAERAASTADSAESLAREASMKAAASAATAGRALATAEQIDRRLSDLRGGRLQSVASTVVMFAFDTADLNDAAQTALTEMVAQVREHPDFMVNLEGYTDAVGSRDYNIQLSQRRATAVLRYLVAQGVELSRIHWVGLGKLSGPAAPEDNAKKRRVTVTVLSATPSGSQASADPEAIRSSPSQGGDQ